MSLQLKLNQSPSALRPWQRIDGVVGWDLKEPPTKATLRLFWYTEGRGEQKVAIIDELELPAGQRLCEGAFYFTVPDAPYSLQGRLIAIKWGIELVLDKGKNVKRLDLVVSPSSHVIKLKKAK